MSRQGTPEAGPPIAPDAIEDTHHDAGQGPEPVDEFSAPEAAETDEEPHIFRGLE